MIPKTTDLLEMTAETVKTPASAPPGSSALEVAVRIGLLGLLGYWSLAVIGPFLTIVLWSAVLTVALYPLFDRLAQRLGSQRVAAGLITAMCLMIVIGPVAWLGFGLIGGVEFAIDGFDARKFSIPLPDESVKIWPLIGEQVYRIWTLAATDTKAILIELAPRLKPLGGKLLEITRTAVFDLVQFIAAILVASLLYSPAPRLVAALHAILRHILGDRSMELMKLCGATIRNVSRGVIGIALVQSFLAGMGFFIADVPASGFFSFLVLFLGIVQIGPAVLILPVVVWSWMTMNTTTAILFTAYMIPVGLIDNVLRPFVMARGMTTPMPVILIGVFGGTIAYGISGLFLGPIVLSVAWALMTAWANEDVDTSCQP